MPTTVDQQAPAGYKLITRVTNYPMVTKAWDSAKGYYTTAKESSPIVRYGMESVESQVQKSVKMIEPALQSDLYKKYSEPILVRADEFGCRQLDNIADISDKLVKKSTEITETYQSSKNLIETKIQSISKDVKSTTKTLTEMSKATLETKIVPPVDTYLKTSLIGVPIALALDVTEKVVDRILPEKEETKAETQKTEVGPVVRAGHLSVKLQKKLQNLTLRSPDQINNMPHVVDLIQYAKSNLDQGVKASSALLSQSVIKGKEMTFSTASTAVSIYTKQQEKVSQKIHNVTHDTIVALNHAIEVLSKQVPEPVSNLSHATYESLKEKTLKFGVQLETIKDITLFTSMAQKGISSLEEAHNILSQYSKTNESANIPTQVITTVASTLDRVVDSLLAFAKQQAPTLQPKGDGKPANNEHDRPLEKEDMVQEKADPNK